MQECVVKHMYSQELPLHPPPPLPPPRSCWADQRAYDEAKRWPNLSHHQPHLLHQCRSRLDLGERWEGEREGEREGRRGREGGKEGGKERERGREGARERQRGREGGRVERRNEEKEGGREERGEGCK